MFYKAGTNRITNYDDDDIKLDKQQGYNWKSDGQRTTFSLTLV